MIPVSFAHFLMPLGLRQARMWLMLLLGFSSGLPLSLVLSTLQAWATVAQIDLKTIGYMTLVSAPYTLKFLWSPIVDQPIVRGKSHFALLGRRRQWLLASQMGVLIGVLIMSLLSPAQAPVALSCAALWVAFASATQDIVFDAWRTDTLQPHERGLGISWSILGYRIAMLVSGALGLYLADQIGWQQMYRLMAMLMTVGIVATLYADEPEYIALPDIQVNISHSGWLTRVLLPMIRRVVQAIYLPFRLFIQRYGARTALAFVVCIVSYKLADALAGVLSTHFLIKGVGYSPAEVGIANKVAGLIATIVGSFVGAWLLNRWGLYRCLMVCAVLQGGSNLSYFALTQLPHDVMILFAAVTIENLCGGMGTTAFVALLMALCDKQYSATQFALLSALSAVVRTYCGPMVASWIAAVGYADFYWQTSLLCLPSVFVVWCLSRAIQQLDRALSSIDSTDSVVI